MQNNIIHISLQKSLCCTHENSCTALAREKLDNSCLSTVEYEPEVYFFIISHLVFTKKNKISSHRKICFWLSVLQRQKSEVNI